MATAEDPDGHRSSSRRSSDRDRDYDRDRERRPDRESKSRPDRGSQRIYEQSEYDDPVEQQQQQQQQQMEGPHPPSGAPPQGMSQKMRMMNAPMGFAPPSSEPPRSLLDAANARPYGRRGPNENPNFDPNYDPQFHRDSSPDYHDSAAVDIRDGGGGGSGGSQPVHRPLSLSIDDLV